MLVLRGSRSSRGPRKRGAWVRGKLSIPGCPFYPQCPRERGGEAACEGRAGGEMAPGGLPFMPPTIAPSQSPAILGPENVLPQLCGNMGIVTHSLPSSKLFWSWAPHSVLFSLLPHSASLLNTLRAQALGKPLGSASSYSCPSAAGACARAQCCPTGKTEARATAKHCLPRGQAWGTTG